MSNLSRIKAVAMELLNIENKKANPGEVLIDIAIGIIAGAGALGVLWVICCLISFISMFVNDTFPKL